MVWCGFVVVGVVVALGLVVALGVGRSVSVGRRRLVGVDVCACVFASVSVPESVSVAVSVSVSAWECRRWCRCPSGGDFVVSLGVQRCQVSSTKYSSSHSCICRASAEQLH